MQDSLREIVSRLPSLTDEDFICAKDRPNWTPNSPAYVVRIPEYTDMTTVGPMPDYFLEVFTARDVLEQWSVLRDRQPTVDEACEALIYYAQHDGHIPLETRP